MAASQSVCLLYEDEAVGASGGWESGRYFVANGSWDRPLDSRPWCRGSRWGGGDMHWREAKGREGGGKGDAGGGLVLRLTVILRTVYVDAPMNSHTAVSSW